jgi:uncharacterized phage protein (TIGR02220 family)
MAERRMFAKTIIDSDAFLEMPLTTQALYFHLAMRADDDGFINNPKRFQRFIGCSDDELKLLIAKRFVIVFESGVIVIKHWRMHNYIRTDRYKPTAYQEEKASLHLKENGSYTLGIPIDNHLETQDRLGKDSIGKENIYSPVIEHLNLKAGTQYRSSSRKTKELIDARVNDGFALDDFKTVIDKKCTTWLHDEKMCKFLRPETLFGTKFESYLNEKISKKQDYNQRTYTAEHFEKDREESIKMIDDWWKEQKNDNAESDDILNEFYEVKK